MTTARAPPPGPGVETGVEQLDQKQITMKIIFTKDVFWVKEDSKSGNLTELLYGLFAVPTRKRDADPRTGTDPYPVRG